MSVIAVVICGALVLRSAKNFVPLKILNLPIPAEMAHPKLLKWKDKGKTRDTHPTAGTYSLAHTQNHTKYCTFKNDWRSRSDRDAFFLHDTRDTFVVTDLKKQNKNYIIKIYPPGQLIINKYLLSKQDVTVIAHYLYTATHCTFIVPFQQFRVIPYPLVLWMLVLLEVLGWQQSKGNKGDSNNLAYRSAWPYQGLFVPVCFLKIVLRCN